MPAPGKILRVARLPERLGRASVSPWAMPGWGLVLAGLGSVLFAESPDYKLDRFYTTREQQLIGAGLFALGIVYLAAAACVVTLRGRHRHRR
jgi:hypothetical protein